MKQSHPCRRRPDRVRLDGTIAIAAALLVSAAAAPLAAQDTMLSDAEREVVSVIETFFEGMLQKDAAKLRSTVAPSAVLWIAQNRDGQTNIGTLPIEQFITSVTTRQGEPANERIYAPRVEMDAGTAHVWTFYTLHVGERFSHCGYDSFQLLRTGEGWKIVSVADTRRTDNCEPPGG
jgi:hypothetical protein